MTIPSRSYLLKNIIESGVDIDKSSYDDLCHYMLDSDGIIQAIELAPDGVVEQVYPLANNEQAVGLDLIHDEERGKNTTLAKDSGRQAIDLFEQSAPRRVRCHPDGRDDAQRGRLDHCSHHPCIGPPRCRDCAHPGPDG